MNTLLSILIANIALCFLLLPIWIGIKALDKSINGEDPHRDDP